MNDEWILAAGLCAAPFLVFGMFEAASALRRRRNAAIARRPKSARASRSGRGRPRRLLNE